MKKLSFFISLLLLFCSALYAQVSINTDNSLPDNSAILDVKSTTKGFLPPRMTQSDRNAIASPAAGLMIFQTDNTPGFYYYNGTAWTAVAGSGSTGHYVGELFGGGIVFYVYDNGQHGLIAATADQSTGIRWHNGSYTTTNAVRDQVNAGRFNTERIIINQGAGSYAAQICANYQGGGYGDWFLPSKYELNLLYLKKAYVGGFADNNYWSSSEYSSGDAWRQYITTGYQSNSDKYNTFCVRAVRAF